MSFAYRIGLPTTNTMGGLGFKKHTDTKLPNPIGSYWYLRSIALYHLALAALLLITIVSSLEVPLAGPFTLSLETSCWGIDRP